MSRHNHFKYSDYFDHTVDRLNRLCFDTFSDVRIFLNHINVYLPESYFFKITSVEKDTEYKKRLQSGLIVRETRSYYLPATESDSLDPDYKNKWISISCTEILEKTSMHITTADSVRMNP